jgi:hypothetical protein
MAGNKEGPPTVHHEMTRRVSHKHIQRLCRDSCLLSATQQSTFIPREKRIRRNLPLEEHEGQVLPEEICL